MDKDFYQTLGINKSASGDEIKKAYRKLAMKYHPDKNQGDKSAEKKFKEINQAYEVLKDEQKRAAYDRYGSSAFENGGSGFSSNTSGFSAGDFHFSSSSSFSDIFENIFSSAMGGNDSGSYRADMRGQDLRYNVDLSLDEAFRGKNIDITLKTSVRCDSCSGTGSENGIRPKVCPACRGSGKTRFTQGFFMVEKTCASCNGTGNIIENSCKICKGSGRIQKIKTINVTIPAGIEDNVRIRLQGEGEAGLRGGSSGDLYVFVSIKKHQLFERRGNEIHCQVPISIVTAALGGEIEVPTIDGKKTTIKIPCGTQNNQMFKLRGKGMSIVRSALRGDMFVHAKVETPINLTKRQKELLNEFDKEGVNQPESEGFFAKVKDFLHELNG